DRGVVPDHVPVALLGEEAKCEATDVPFGVGRAALTGNGGAASAHLGLFADLGEDCCAGVLGDVLVDGEGAPGARPLGVHAALGDDLAVEVRQLLQEPDVLQQHRPTGPGRHCVVVVPDRCAGGGGQGL